MARQKSSKQEILFHRPYAAPVEDASQQLDVSAAVQIPVGINDSPGAAGKGRKAVQLEMALDNSRVSDFASECSSNLPQRRGPNLAIVDKLSLGATVVRRR